jgi:hypothetical protein
MANSVKECLKVVLVGGPHAAATAAELEARGANVQLLHLPYYRDSSVHSGKMKEGLEKLAIDAETVLIIQVFDSGLYMAKTEEGALIPLCRRADGTYHIDGVLEFLSRDMQYSLFKLILEETMAYRSNNTIFMAPLPAYLEEGCCGDPDHASNRASPAFKKTLEEAIYAARANIKNFAFRNGLRKCTTISTWSAVKRLAPIWDGPINLTKQGYAAIADCIIKCIEELQRKRGGETHPDAPAAKKARAQQQQQLQQQTQPPQPTRGRGWSRGRGGGGHVHPQHQQQHPGNDIWVWRGRGRGAARGGNGGGWRGHRGYGGQGRRGHGGR